jgi:hypothetical protein
MDSGWDSFLKIKQLCNSNIISMEISLRVNNKILNLVDYMEFNSHLILLTENIEQPYLGFINIQNS